METYLDAGKPVEARVEDLLARMTLDEKIAQLGSIWGMEVLEGRSFSAGKGDRLMRHGIGGISRVGVGTTLEPAEIAAYVNDLQRYLAGQTRLKIPAIVHEECLAGFVARGATVFPQIIGLASAWEPQLVRRIMEVTRRQMLAAGVRQGLSPVLDVCRDPRWGRLEETFGEDPFLIACNGVEYVNGLQGNDIREGVIATVKHFAGYGKSEAGLNHAPADIPERMLREIYLYPFERAVREAGVLSVMNAYQEIDGIPCAASARLLSSILREEWGFKGAVVSDYYAVTMLWSVHRVAADATQAASMALRAGIDMELPRNDCFSDAFKSLVAAGKFPAEVLDRAVSRVLSLKFRLGLFERPYIGTPDIKDVFDNTADRALALEAARKSIVLLKNDKGLLPLDRAARIAVIGPCADSPRNQVGDYSYPGQLGVTLITAQSLNCPLPNAADADEVPVRVVTLLEGIRAKVGNVTYAGGCRLDVDDGAGIGEAVRLAKEASVAVVAVGGKSGLTSECSCGEMRDSASLRLAGVQEELVKAVFDTGTPVVLVIMDGRPVTLGWMADRIPGIVMAWKPGEEGGNALADMLFGDASPGGKLPVTYPYSVGQVPVYYGVKPSGGKSQFWGDYTDCPARPLYEFGFGLSYTTFELNGLAVSPAVVSPGDTIKVTLNVRNTGRRRGDEVVQVYINDIVASVARPAMQLKGFRRVSLEPGETAAMEIVIPVSDLAFYDADMKLQVEPGAYAVLVGNSSRNITLLGQFEVV